MIAFFASPLLWMTPSSLSRENAATIQKMLKLYRQYRAEWRDAIISPMGDRPDGKQITGFYADSGYALIFREKDAPESREFAEFQNRAAEIIYATAPTELAANGKITISQPRAAALIKLQ